MKNKRLTEGQIKAIVTKFTIEVAELLNVDVPTNINVKMKNERGNRRNGITNGGGYNAFTDTLEVYAPYIMQGKKINKGTLIDTIAHELTHKVQTEKEGGADEFFNKYKYNELIYGYERNPYEVEAREVGNRIALQYVPNYKQPLTNM